MNNTDVQMLMKMLMQVICMTWNRCCGSLCPANMCTGLRGFPGVGGFGCLEEAPTSNTGKLIGCSDHAKMSVICAKIPA